MKNKIHLFISLVLFFLVLTSIGCKKEYEVVKAKPISESQESNIDSLKMEIDYDQQTLTGGDSSRIKSTEKASVNFSNAITYQNSAWRMSYYLGKSYLEQDQYLQAISHLEYALTHSVENNKDRFRIYIGLARSYESIGKTGKAILAYHTASRIFPDSKEVKDGFLRLKQTAQLE